MKIERLEVNGFGRLRGHDLEFIPTINVVAGPNEAGKSTLAEAMQALLFGFTDHEKARAPTDLLKQFRPWSGGLFGGALRVRLKGDECYRIVRDFVGSTTKVYREPGATDVTSQYASGRHGWTDFADRHLGMSRTVFRSSGWIDQGQLAYGRDQHSALKDKLEHLVGAPEDGVSAQVALAKLSEWLSKRINAAAHSIDRSPYLTAGRRVNELHAELEQSRAALEELEQLVIDQRALEGKLKDDGDDLAQIEALLAARELTGIQDKLSRLATIDKDLLDVRSALSDLRDVAQLESRWLSAAENALVDVERIRATSAAAQEVVASEREAYDLARSELGNVDRELAQLPNVGEDQLSAVEEVVRPWDAANRRLSEVESDLADARRRLQTKESEAMERLMSLGPGAAADVIGSAILSVETASQRLSDARADLDRLSVSPADEDEFDRLNQQIGELTGAGLGDLEQREHRLELTRQQSAVSRSRTPLLIGLAILIGLGLGFALLGGLGAAIGAVIGGVVGIVAASGLAKSSDAPDASQVAKNAALLEAELRRYGVDSTRELRAVWDRRNELAGTVAQVRAMRVRVNEREADLEQALADLVQVGGTRDLEEASKLAQQLRQDQYDRQNLQRGLENVERLAREAAAGLSNRRTEALKQLTSLDIAVETAAQAFAALAQLRTTQAKRRELLRQKAELAGSIRLYTEHEAALGRCKQDLAKMEAQLTVALEKVDLVLPLTDPAAALEARRGRFGEYQSLRAKEQSVGSSRDVLIGGEDPAEWLRRQDALADRARSADLADERSREDLEARRAAVHRERDYETRLLSEIEAKLAAAMRQVREPAVIEEELAEAERQNHELERLKNALEGARQTLAQVATDFQRSFAPRLESRIGKSLAQITAGRYGEVSIDPTDLAVRIKTFERTDLVELDGLSHGTRDAIALLLRASVAQLLSNNDEPVPLFLDDPLVHVDSDRTRRVFDVIQELSQEWQIFYFTQDQRVLDWAKGNGESVRLCELPPPPCA